MYDRGLATRLHELTATLFDREETQMSGRPAHMINGHTCFALWDDYLVIRIGNESASKLVKDDDFQNYIYIAILLTCTLPPKTAKRAPKRMHHKAD